MTTYRVDGTCPFCGRHTHVFVDLVQYGCWLEGMKIQDAMPDMSLTERETLISGLCPECQAEMLEDEAERMDRAEFDFEDDSECGFAF